MSATPVSSLQRVGTAPLAGDEIGAGIDHTSWVACCLSSGARAPLSPDDIESLAADMTVTRHAGGTFVFRRGQPATAVHVVRSGSVELSRFVGGRRVTLQLLGPGDVFGDVPALLDGVAPFDARAHDDTVLLSLGSPALLALLRTRPGVAQRWFVSLAERMSGLHDRLVNLLAGSLESRLASTLLCRRSEHDTVRLTHAQLAELLGVPRSSVQRVLKSMETEGLVELRYRRIELTDRRRLAALVEHRAG